MSDKLVSTDKSNFVDFKNEVWLTVSPEGEVTHFDEEVLKRLAGSDINAALFSAMIHLIRSGVVQNERI